MLSRFGGKALFSPRQRNKPGQRVFFGSPYFTRSQALRQMMGWIGATRFSQLNQPSISQVIGMGGKFLQINEGLLVEGGNKGALPDVDNSGDFDCLYPDILLQKPTTREIIQKEWAW